MKTTDVCHNWGEWSDEDGVYLGKCSDPIFPIHGDLPVRLSVELAELVEEVIGHFEETGRPLPHHHRAADAGGWVSGREIVEVEAA